MAARLLYVAGAAAALAATFVLLRPSGPDRTTDPQSDAPIGSTDLAPGAAARPGPGPRAPSPRAQEHDERPPPPARVDEPEADDPLHEVRVARADPSDEGTAALVALARDDDEVVVAEATRALVARRATSAIGALATIDLRDAAGAGSSIIEALGRLGATADPAARGAAVDRLLAMLAEEKRRGGRESPGNLLQIYEALGETRDARAAAPLEAELLDPALGRAPKVVVVQALARIGEASSRTAFLGARQQHSTPDADPFEEELRRELVAALEAALTSL